MTQTELAGDRFSKEYVSQIERGKTRPTAETIAWLANRLGVDARLPRERRLDRRAWPRRGHARARRGARPRRTATRRPSSSTRRSGRRSPRPAPPSSRRAPLGRGLGPHAAGRASRPAIELLVRAQTLTEGPSFSDVDRAEVLYRLGSLPLQAFEHLHRDSRSSARRYDLAERSELPCDVLRSNILAYRSRCYRRQRDLKPRGGRGARARAGAVARRPPDDGERVRPGLARRRAPGPLGARPQLRGARQGATTRS